MKFFYLVDIVGDYLDFLGGTSPISISLILDFLGMNTSYHIFLLDIKHKSIDIPIMHYAV